MDGVDPKALVDKAMEVVWHDFTQMSDYRKEGARIIVKGEGSLVWDINGHELIDAQGGMWTTQVGHGRKEIAEAVARQTTQLEYYSLFSFSNVPAIKLAEKLCSLAPGKLGVARLVSSGSEAIENAFKISRQYQSLMGFTKRYKVIARRRTYHGGTMGALSASGITQFRAAFEPLVPGFRHIPQPDCYRCELGLTYPHCGIGCARALEQQLLFENPETVAAFIAEPVSTGDGVIVPPPEYYPMCREICSKYGVLFIADEVLTGFGRTGKLFACEHWGVEPDLMTFAKGVTSGYLPLGGVMLRTDISDQFLGGLDESYKSGQTYSGHPVCSVAALVNIEIMERENLIERGKEIGEYLGGRLQELRKHPIVGNISGLGMLHGVHFVEDRTTRERLRSEISRFIWLKAWEKGVVYRYISHGVGLAPPLILTKEQADQIVDVLHESILEAEKHFNLGTTT
jgi:adenosylmethionine-8-amino-7-oxononanoate aminotransferase